MNFHGLVKLMLKLCKFKGDSYISLTQVMGLFAAFCNDPDMITVCRAIRTATHTTQSPGITWKFMGNKELHIYIVPPHHLA